MSFRLTSDLNLENAARRVGLQISFLSRDYIYWPGVNDNAREIARYLGYDLQDVDPYRPNNFQTFDEHELLTDLCKELAAALAFKNDRRMMAALKACVWRE